MLSSLESESCPPPDANTTRGDATEARVEIRHAQTGEAFGCAPCRRVAGRIAGLLGPGDPAAVARMAQVLGPGTQVLLEPPRLGRTIAVDCDACWLGEQLVRSIADWNSIVAQGKLSSVTGAFAIAILEADGSLTLARDAIGERTLYYAVQGEQVLFASSIRALLSSGRIRRELYLPAVAAYLSYAYVPGSDTLFVGVQELLPGEVVRFSGGNITREALWVLPAEPAGQPAPSEQCLREALRERLETAVRRRLPGEGEPIGASLSGGLDSSLVVALARLLHRGPVRTYSVSFGEGYANELPFSSLVAAHCGTQHAIVEISPSVVLHHLEDSIGLLGEPIGDPLTVPNALLFREAGGDVAAILNGEGGDPCFGGPKNLPMLLAELFGDGHEPLDKDDQNNDGLARERSYLRAHQKCFDDLDRMLSPHVRDALATTPLEAKLHPWFTDGRWHSLITRLMAMNASFKGGHHILPKVDALSAPFGVVPRSPLFDREVVEAAFTIPPQLKLHGSVEKYLLKQAVADLLPAAILNRPKSGMLVPVEAWFRGPLLSAARERLLDGLAPLGLIQRPYLEKLLAGRLGGLRPRHGAKIWLLITLEAWLRRTATAAG